MSDKPIVIPENANVTIAPPKMPESLAFSTLTDAYKQLQVDYAVFRMRHSEILDRQQKGMQAEINDRNIFINELRARVAELEQNNADLRQVSALSTSSAKNEIDFLLDKVAELENPWISVADRLPDDGQCVFVYGQATRYDWDHFENGQFNYNKDVTHWMPIPENRSED